jgi:16S rRNA (cytosine967-C5)-methyltransferase
MDREIEIAARVVAQAQRGQPADAALREVLRAGRGLSADTARAISQAVFAFFRWRGWLNPGEPLERQLVAAGELAVRFAREPQGFSDAELARAVPDWIGEAMDVSPAWLRSLQAEPRLWLRAKRGHAHELAAALGGSWIPGQPALRDAVQYLGHEDLFVSKEFHAGLFEVQDVASQIVGLLCDPQPGQTWWDACAGEGGKTLHLSDLIGNKGLIWSSDRAEWRLKRLKLRARRAHCFNYRARLWDGGAKLPTKTLFDGVLVDAPCSGVGTWGRNPHARWTTTERDVSELAAVQRRLLDHVAPAVKPGGKLLYAVCTLTRAETTGVAAAFQAKHPEFEPLELGPVELPVKSESLLTSAPTICLWPQATGGNGMFVAAWRRRGNPPLSGGGPAS